jgi:UDP-glucose 6-dehydrogenase
MNISIIGTGYVGLVTGTCLADFGLSVTCVDQDETKISLLNKESKVIFIVVGTPSNDDGSTNLVQIEEVAQEIALSTPSPLRGEGRVRVKYPFDLVSNPEFLREGSAVYDFTHPDKIEYFDPLAMENSRKVLPTLTYCQDEYDTARNSHALVILTEWNQFRNIDLSKIKKLLKTPVLLDLKNLYEPEKVKSLGFIYEGIGRN